MNQKKPSADTNQQIKPQVVHVARPYNPEKPILDEMTKLKHERSSNAYPELNLCESEYVINLIKRHPIGLFMPFVISIFLITLSLAVLFSSNIILESWRSNGSTVNSMTIILPVLLFMSLVALVTYVAYFIYTNNKYFLTNESVIQEIQSGLFSHSEQTISLGNIEDVGFIQNGILEQIFDYGSIRLCTQGDEAVYLFAYIPSPKQSAAILNDAVEAFKNGRPVGE